MGYQTQSAYGHMPAVNFHVNVMRVTNHERGVDHIIATCIDPFGATTSSSVYVEADYIPGEHEGEGEGFYALDIEVAIGVEVSTFRV
jgi:hypothetical protein